MRSASCSEPTICMGKLVVTLMGENITGREKSIVDGIVTNKRIDIIFGLAVNGHDADIKVVYGVVINDSFADEEAAVLDVGLVGDGVVVDDLFTLIEKACLIGDNDNISSSPTQMT
ncbi:hypothetical protein NDU88_006409 [Pleurodeles waltl]|uniref:Uncharacterized protein n=1 Tax=Pleurodeles waltl TaxID=8319 RepID=A0AAV7NRQ9_PLEWA|nr:hypothetical protein NDU88_006409 [Pleurodeles waltl]